MIDAVFRGPTNRHRFVVRHPSREGVIGVDNAGALPSIDTDDRHTADVEHLNDGIRARYGLRTTVLRSLLHGEVKDGVVERAHELESHGSADGALVWRSADSLARLDAADRAVLTAWRAPFTIAGGRDWMAPGWFARACAWTDAALRRGGRSVPSEIRQIRTWSSSCVLRVDVDAATAYLKALPENSCEYRLTRWLAEHHPSHVAPLIDEDASRRWLLLGACRGRNLETIAEVGAWSDAARRYAQLQLACTARADELHRIGCPKRSLRALPNAVAALANDAVARSTGDGLTDAELDRIRTVAPTLAERCAELSAVGIPDSLEHGDLWPGNIFVDEAASATIDWEDAAIAHPFLSLAPLLVGLDNAGLGTDANVDRLKAAYARPFESLVPRGRLRRALDLAAPLCFLDMAVRYRAQSASVVRLHPWMRDLVPQAVRLALARL